jgi:hypothetical protein
MFENNSYGVKFFGKFNDIDINSDPVWELMNDLRGLRLLPTSFYELNANNEGITPISRPAFTSTENDFIVEIGSEFINIQKTNKDSSVGEISAFKDSSLFVLDKIISRFNKRGTRVALTSTGLIEIDQSKLEDAYTKFITPIKYYEDNKPFEWSSRSISHDTYQLNGNEEKINIVTDIGRLQGRSIKSGIPTPFDKLSLSFDINTVPQLTESRLDTKSVEDFLNNAIESRKQILSQVELVLNG